MLDAAAPAFELPEIITAWFAERGWTPRPHQLDVTARALRGESALLIAPTGGGKTLAGFLASLVELNEAPSNRPRLHTLYISPLKALAVDVERNLQTPVAEMGLNIRIETRTGDTSAAKRQRQRANPPDILLTTPEQLALFVASDHARDFFQDLRCVIIDEIHAIAPSKRGDLLSLG
ncbi:MAG: DEAD/DEAH box helicase, partial [Pseudomonadota bacterium]